MHSMPGKKSVYPPPPKKNDLCSRMDRKQRPFCYTIEFLNRGAAYSTLII